MKTKQIKLFNYKNEKKYYTIKNINKMKNNYDTKVLTNYEE